jgi:hypothetical protein
MISNDLLSTLAIGPVDAPIPGATGYLERPSKLKTLETEPYYSLVKAAGAKTPVDGDGDEIPTVTCPNSKCQAEYVAFWRGPKICCPVCRRPFRV